MIAVEGAGDGPRLLLASASPRRRELLGLLGVGFTVVVSRFDEASLSHLTDPIEYVRAAAGGKAEEVARRRAGIVLGVDTDVVAPGGQILGKPSDANAARRMLRLMSGNTHWVYSGVVVVVSDGSGAVSYREEAVVGTSVTFTRLSDETIDRYVATGEPQDKAGGYAIQGGAMPFIARIEGDFSSVIGLPLVTTAEMLHRCGMLF